MFAYHQVVEGSVIFRFGFDFGSDSRETSLKTSLQIGDNSEDHHTSDQPEISPTTTAPYMTDIWTRQAKLNATANGKLRSSRLAVTQLRSDLSNVVGRSDYIAGKVKLMTRYLLKANAALESTTSSSFEILQDFVQLVDDLKVPPSEEVGGERSLDYVVMKMALDKYKLAELQTQTRVDVLQGVEAWQDYVKNKMIDVMIA